VAWLEGRLKRGGGVVFCTFIERGEERQLERSRYAILEDQTEPLPN
jgi:hypothetical protein